MSSTSATARPARFSPAWWVTGRDGSVTIAQLPNPAISVWIAAVVLGWTNLLDSDTELKVRYVGNGALIVWGLDELLRGSSPARRVLGLIVLAFQLVRLFG